MKYILLTALATLFVSCAPGGGGSNGTANGGVPPAPPVTDPTPHDYSILAQVAAMNGQNHSVRLRQICDNGQPGFRDESVDLILNDTQPTGGTGCAGVLNVIMRAQNLGGFDVYAQVSIDGVAQGAVLLIPGQVYEFTRGY